MLLMNKVFWLVRYDESSNKKSLLLDDGLMIALSNIHNNIDDITFAVVNVPSDFMQSDFDLLLELSALEFGGKLSFVPYDVQGDFLSEKITTLECVHSELLSDLFYRANNVVSDYPADFRKMGYIIPNSPTCIYYNTTNITLEGDVVENKMESLNELYDFYDVEQDLTVFSEELVAFLYYRAIENDLACSVLYAVKKAAASFKDVMFYVGDVDNFAKESEKLNKETLFIIGNFDNKKLSPDININTFELKAAIPKFNRTVIMLASMMVSELYAVVGSKNMPFFVTDAFGWLYSKK